MTNTPPLAQLLPHDTPMILIDDLISVGGRKCALPSHNQIR